MKPALRNYRIADTQTEIELFQDRENAVVCFRDGELETFTSGTSEPLYVGPSVDEARQSLELSESEWYVLLSSDVHYLELTTQSKHNNKRETNAMASTDLKTFFAVASPTTLASLVADIENIDERTDEQLELSMIAFKELCAIVGDEEANRLAYYAATRSFVVKAKQE